MKSRKNKKIYPSVRAFKKSFSEAIEYDKKSMNTESDRQFLQELLKTVNKQNQKR